MGGVNEATALRASMVVAGVAVLLAGCGSSKPHTAAQVRACWQREVTALVRQKADGYADKPGFKSDPSARFQIAEELVRGEMASFTGGSRGDLGRVRGDCGALPRGGVRLSLP